MAAKAIPSAVTPQAVDDSSRTQEDSSVTIDVLLNDRGGAAKQLYSVDQSNPLVPTSIALSTMGAQIMIANGQVAYDPSAASKIQALRAGDTATDTFSYAMRLADGTVSTATVSIALTGANDIASISGKATGAVKEDVTATASGTLTVTDVDTGENTFGQVGPLAGQYGSFSFNNGSWSYLVANASTPVQMLAAGVKVQDTLEVKSKDGTATETIVVSLEGSNDLASIKGDTRGALQEDSTTTTVKGTLTVQDVDTGEALFGIIGSLAGTYGTFTFDKGNWDYTLANDSVQTLGGGAIVKDRLVVESKDGSASETIEVSIAGANDVAKISGVSTGAVREDGTLTTGGKLTVTDLDAGEAAFGTIGNLEGAYGTFTFDKGSWGYTLDNSKAQALSGNDVVSDTLKIASIDGTEHTISVEIQGANEPVPVAANLIDFEDLSGAGSTIPGNYKGFNWASGYLVLHTLHEDSHVGSGYQNGSISPGKIVAFTPFAIKPVNITRTDGGDFVFDKVYLTAAWDASAQATVTGYNNGVVVGSLSVNIHDEAPTLVDVDWASIDELRINSTGQHLVLDNFFMG